MYILKFNNQGAFRITFQKCRPMETRESVRHFYYWGRVSQRKQLWNPAERETVREGNIAAEGSSILSALVYFLKKGRKLTIFKI